MTKVAGLAEPRTLLRMRTQRQVVDYSLAKRALLREVYADRVGVYEVCDASPYLKSAARFHGDPTEQRCPICRRENLTHVHYIYGDELKAVGRPGPFGCRTPPAGDDAA